MDAQLQGELLAKLAHDVRTPVAVLLAVAARPDAPGFADEVRQSASSILEHIDDLGTYARLSAGRLTLCRAQVDLAAAARAVVADRAALAKERSVTLWIDAEERAEVEGDPVVLRRIVGALVTEALRHATAGATVTCVVAQEDDVVALQVVARRRDADERWEEPEDRTLGMALVEPLVRLHGGEVQVQRRDGTQFEIRVELPSAPWASASPASVPPASSAAETLVGRAPNANVDAPHERALAQAAAPLGSRPRVLVVEDDPGMNRFLAATLASEYEVETAWNGTDGLARAFAQPPDLILTDLRMPLGGGDRLVRELRCERAYDGVPILVLTADPNDALCVELLRAGAQDHVRKPCTAEELRARVRNLVTSARARALLQSELTTQQTDLEALARELAQRTREVERASAVKSDFLRLASHELRTPLTALKLQLEFLRRLRRDATPKESELLRKAFASLGRLQDLVESLLEYTRIESGKLVVEAQPVDVCDVCASAVEELRAQATAKGLVLRFVSPEPALQPVITDAKIVRLIVVNLVGNAIKFTTQGSVDVTCGASAGEHWVSVRDTGPGIPDHARAAIFEPFVQLERLDRKHLPGVGLGLSLVKQLVGALGGRVELDTLTRDGAHFTVYLRNLA